MKNFKSLLIIYYFITEVSGFSQQFDIAASSQRFVELYQKGDIINAEKCLLQVLDSLNPIPYNYKTFIYNGLGVTNLFFGRYEKAYKFLDLAEKSRIEVSDSYELAGIYVNKAIIFYERKSFETAIEYYEKAIRIYHNLINNGSHFYLDLSKAYMNLSIVCSETNNHNLAVEYLNKSLYVAEKMHLSAKGLIYLNIAKTYKKIGSIQIADDYFNRSINNLISEFNEEYFRLPEVYFEYGNLLAEGGSLSDAKEIHYKALRLLLNNFGKKHMLVSRAFKLIGDDFLINNEMDSAVYYYQKSLIAIVPEFNDPDVFSNPPIDSSLFDIRLLDNLKSKSNALSLYASAIREKEEKTGMLRESLETIELAINLIDKIRKNYPDEESRLYIAENEKKTYESALHVADDLFLLSGDELLKQKIYDIARKARAMVLIDEITGNEILYNAGIPDSLIMEQNNLTGSISAYNDHIRKALEESSADTTKVPFWKDAIFEMNRRKEKIAADIDNLYPQYNNLFRKTEPVPLPGIQRRLGRNEAVIDYFLCSTGTDGSRDLYTFFLTRDKLAYFRTGADTLFMSKVRIIQNAEQPSAVSGLRDPDPASFINALSSLYRILIKPLERDLKKGMHLIFIPDEEIALVPFEALVCTEPKQEPADYEGVDFLINNYPVSYGYSSSLIFGNGRPGKGGNKILSFAPDYGYGAGAEAAGLPGAGKEIESLYKWFGGRKYTGTRATETAFRESMNSHAIFHLAMHSVRDTANSKYSYLLFSSPSDPLNDGRLYNYEISLGRISSPMVVLSACNSGSGTLYRSEGVMGLARSFILAGASSVVRTSWEINDEVSTTIMTRFYNYLSKGKDKDVALRLAKLEFMNSHPPSFSNPRYWASYEIVGDNGPVTNNRLIVVATGSLLAVCIIMLLIYFRRRRILADRSL